jgi:hypothetical protein
MANHKKYYMGRRWWLPTSLGRDEFCESMYAHGSSMHQKCSNHAYNIYLCYFMIYLILYVIINYYKLLYLKLLYVILLSGDGD